MAGVKGSNALIQQLLEAEEEADTIVNKAKENRVKMLKDARFSAEEELKVFRAKEEERFKAEYEQTAGQEDSLVSSLEAKTKGEIEGIKKDYVENKDALIKFIHSKVMDVDLSLTAETVAVLRNCEMRGVTP
ncbi:putative vacuolar ATP synthase subunit g [Besnoitia besnoiti]|uniref:V-type proton ATPase subunit G n=1 Tax=Besnoitia besnoiti TaxID=94643 RepID=A0A2A9MID5_BESBE|nr:putative vacuolar ATP synthase subunit g [Besnoitia besnoiti]PFH38298.1 putative vacuolar ATP synthase subunit g [Besnoitia besnoiti]